MKTKWLIASLFMLLMGLGAIMSLTNPSAAHPVVLLAFFVLLYLLTTLLLVTAYYLSLKLISYLVTPSKTSKLLNMPLNKVYIYSSLIGLFPVMMIAMNSVGALSPYSVMLALVFEVLAIIYVKRTS